MTVCNGRGLHELGAFVNTRFVSSGASELSRKLTAKIERQVGITVEGR